MSDVQLTCVGAIAGAFGVRGELRVKSFCGEPEALFTYSPLTGEDGTGRYVLTLSRPVKNGFAARMEGVTTREEAEALRGLRLYARRDQLPSLPDDEFYHADLIGLQVLDTGGAELGRVKSVQDHGAGDLLEIHAPGLRATVLLPFTREAVPTVDLDGGRIIADPPDGLFPDSGGEDGEGGGA